MKKASLLLFSTLVSALLLGAGTDTEEGNRKTFYENGNIKTLTVSINDDGTTASETVYKNDRPVAGTLYRDGKPLEKVCAS